MDNISRIDGESFLIGRYKIEIAGQRGNGSNIPNDRSGMEPHISFACDHFRFDGGSLDFAFVSRLLLANGMLSGKERCIFSKGPSVRPFEADGLLPKASSQARWELGRLISMTESAIDLGHPFPGRSFRAYATGGMQLALLASGHGSTWGASMDLSELDSKDPCELPTFFVPSAKELSYAAMLDLFPDSKDWLFDPDWIRGMPREERETLVGFESIREDLAQSFVRELSRDDEQDVAPFEPSL